MGEPLQVTAFGTSIWDETLYKVLLLCCSPVPLLHSPLISAVFVVCGKAWSSIVYALVPNVDKLETQLHKFCGLCGADEVVLFEKATFLVISHATQKQHSDVHRFEKISNIIKQFKLSCR
jgi:Ras-related GTP-binding protein A/B